MSFSLWANEAMTQKLGDATLRGVNHVGVALHNREHAERVFYFGSPNAAHTLQTAVNGGVNNIEITPKDALPNRTGETDYQVGDCVEPANGGGYVYQCTQAGKTATTAPSWLKVSGSHTADGTVVWRCMGKRFQIADVKLALSAEGLNSATSGAPLSLGHTLKGGAAVAIYVRILGNVGDFYDLRQVPFVSLDLNECVVNG